MFPISEAFAEEFQISKRGKVRVTVGMSGTGGGFKKFCRGETDMSNASRPISTEEMEVCRKNGVKYIELPVAFDALTVVDQPEQQLGQGQCDDGGRAQEDVGAGGAGPHHAAGTRSTPSGPTREADAVRRRAPTRARSTTSPRPSTARRRRAAATSRPARTTTRWCRASSTTRSALGYFGFAYYAAHKDKLTRGRDRTAARARCCRASRT
ncbi:MAG: substrate-binding domain-containing protein [Chromatiales bacterium]|nr:substrate-binding domain-containing protein [Chromatiales bacterium]